MVCRRRQIDSPMLCMRQMFGHPHARRSARLSNVRRLAILAMDGIDHSRVFLWVTRILEAVLKRPFPLARSSYDADAERTKNALDSLRGFVDKRYHYGCGIRVVPFAKNWLLLSFLTAQTRKLVVNERRRISVLQQRALDNVQLCGLLGAIGAFRPDEDQGNPGRNVVSDKKCAGAEGEEMVL